MSEDRTARSDIEKEARRVLPYLKGEKKYTAFLDCSRYFLDYGWSAAKAYSKTDEADTIRKEAIAFFNNLDSKAFDVGLADVSDMDLCYLELFGVSKDHQRKNLGTQAVYQLSDFLYYFMGSKTTPIVYGIYITAPMSKVTKPYDFYRKIGFKEGLPFGFAPWLALNNDMMHLSVEPADKNVALLRDIDLISPKVDKKLDAKTLPKKQMRNAIVNVVHHEEQKVDVKALAVNQINEPAIKQKATQALKSKHTVSDTLSSVDEYKSSYSIVTHKTTKSGLAIDKHCGVEGCGKLIKGTNWTKHKRNHGLDEVLFAYCSSLGCILCAQGKLTRFYFGANSSYFGANSSYFGANSSYFGANSSYFGANSSYFAQNKHINHGKHQYTQCIMCGEDKRADTVKGGVCMLCVSRSKKRDIKKIQKQQNYATQMIKSSVPQGSNSALCSLAGTKRPHSINLLDGGLEEMKDFEGNDISPSPKRVKSVAQFVMPQNISEFQVEEQQQQDIFMQQDESSVGMHQPAVVKEVIIEKLVVLAHTDKEVIDQLKSIAVSDKSTQFCASTLQDICHMFTQEYVNTFLATQSEQKKLVDCIIEVLKRVDQLNDGQVIGLLAASFAIGGTAWTSSVKLLNDMTDQRRTETLKQFGLYLGKNNKQSVVEWCQEYWKVTEQQHLDLIKYLREHPTSEDNGVCILSLTVAIQSNEEFESFSSAFIRSSMSAAGIMVDTIAKYPKQNKISFDEFVALTAMLQDKSNSDAIQSIQDELLTSQINRWAKMIGEAQKAQGVADAESIQSFLDWLVQAYGQVKYNKDLTLTEDDRFSMFLIAAENIPNNRQFAFAQYCVALLASTPRQLWNVPAGQGKGRIEHAIVMIALFLGVVPKVHMVYNCQELLERDQSEFQSYLMFLDDASSVEYHIGIEGWELQEGELIVVDEADAIIFKDASTFRAFIAKSACLCFTATPDDQGRALDKKVIAALQIKQFHYYLDKHQQRIDLIFDLTSKAVTLQEKAVVVKEYSAFGPVLVYCGDDLLQQLQSLGFPLLIVNHQIDHSALRVLDQAAEINQYQVVVATDLFAMRGLDYRSKNVGMTFVLAKSFTNWRDACQGYNRVGRFGDACKRIQFADIPLIDAKEELKYKAECCKFVVSMQKSKVEMKPVKVKEVAPPASKEAKVSYKSSKLTQKRVNTLVQTNGTSALIQTKLW